MNDSRLSPLSQHSEDGASSSEHDQTLDTKIDKLKQSITCIPDQIQEQCISPGFARITRDLQGLDSRAEGSQNALEAIQARIANMAKQLDGGDVGNKLDKVVFGVDDIREQIPVLLHGMGAIQAQVSSMACGNPQTMTLSNLPPPPDGSSGQVSGVEIV